MNRMTKWDQNIQRFRAYNLFRNRKEKFNLTIFKEIQFAICNFIYDSIYDKSIRFLNEKHVYTVY